MPSSHQPLLYPIAMSPRAARLLLSVACVVSGVGACQTRDQSRFSGIETGAVNPDTATRNTSFKTDTAKPVEPGKLRVSNVMIGRRLGTENRISEPTLRFAPTDTVFLSIATEGTPDSATLNATWTFPTGKVQDSASQTIRPKGTEHAELHAVPPKGGWPIGSYLIKVYANGDSADAKTIAVQK
jgi:hypothetical protein